MAFRKRDTFEDSAPPKNSYEASDRRKGKALKDYDMRPHWIKNDNTVTSMNPQDEERAGAEDEEDESLTLLKKEMKKSAYDDVMDIVLGNQEMIHHRAMDAHRDRMSILKQYCGYEVWEDAEKDNAPGAARSVTVEVEEFDHEGAKVTKLDRSFISKSAAQQLHKLNPQQQQHQHQDQKSEANNSTTNKSSTNNNLDESSSHPPLAPTSNNTTPAAKPSTAVTNTTTTTATPSEVPPPPPSSSSAQKLHYTRGGLDQLDDDLTVTNKPLHVAILTPPVHGCIPLDHRHLMKGNLSYKMETSIAKMDEAVRHFQVVNEAAREEMMERALIKQHQDQQQQMQQQQRTGSTRSGGGGGNRTPAGVVQSAQKQQQNRKNHQNNYSGTISFATNTSQNQTSLETSKLLEQRMAREQRLEEGLFTAFHNQGGYSGLHGNPTSDPHARSPPRSSNRRYPDPYAFVIH